MCLFRGPDGFHAGELGARTKRQPGNNPYQDPEMESSRRRER